MQNVHDTFTELSRELRRLKELPLSVSSLQATSPTFRYTEVTVITEPYDVSYRVLCRAIFSSVKYFQMMIKEEFVWEISMDCVP